MPSKLYMFSFLLLFSGLGSKLYSQMQELKDFENGTARTFFGGNLSKSKGLKFSIKYPSFYTISDVDDVNVVKTFVNELGVSGYSVVVQKRDSSISDDEKMVILSKYSMQQNIAKAYKSYKYLEHKKDLKVNEFDASYIEYYTDLNRDIDTYMRQYAIVINEYYVVTITFIITEMNRTTIEKVKEKFVKYKPFFEKVVATFKVSD